MKQIIEVHSTWDSEAEVWVATSEDVPGLAIEAETTERLIERLKTVIPELLELNGLPHNREIPFHLLSERTELARAV